MLGGAGGVKLVLVCVPLGNVPISKWVGFVQGVCGAAMMPAPIGFIAHPYAIGVNHVLSIGGLTLCGEVLAPEAYPFPGLVVKAPLTRFPLHLPGISLLKSCGLTPHRHPRQKPTR